VLHLQPFNARLSWVHWHAIRGRQSALVETNEASVQGRARFTKISVTDNCKDAGDIASNVKTWVDDRTFVRWGISTGQRSSQIRNTYRELFINVQVGTAVFAAQLMNVLPDARS
jgi:hypothetical protein